MSIERLQQRMSVSAPGKIILFGEHSVVYGKQAVAFSLGLRTELTLNPANDAVILHLPEIKVEKSWNLDTLNGLWEKLKKTPINDHQPQDMSEEEGNILKEFLEIEHKEIGKRELGLMAFFHLYMAILPHPVPFSISVKSQMPVGAGLGSSAAYAVCLAGLLKWLTGDLNLADLHNKKDENSVMRNVCDWALQAEKIVHGTPSGIDNAICTYGEAISFKSGKIDRISAPSLRIMLVNTGVTRNSKTQINIVREKYTRLNSLIDPLLISMDRLAQSAVKTINEMKSNSLSSDCIKTKISYLQELVDLNQNLLSALGVSHPRLDRVVSIAQSHGFHAKLTGAGGGGFGFLLLSPDTSQNVIDACCKVYKAEGFETWITCLGSEGLTMAPLQ